VTRAQRLAAKPAHFAGIARRDSEIRPVRIAVHEGKVMP